MIIEDSWTVIDNTDFTSAADLPAGDLILPLQVWKTLATDLQGRNIGIWLNSDQHPTDLKEICQNFPIIAINFPVFSDGRGYSYAHVLRAQLNYKGELRAIGDVLMDQLFYMKRCGFDSYALRQDQKPEIAIRHLQDFNVTYQAAIDTTEPLFRSR